LRPRALFPASSRVRPFRNPWRSRHASGGAKHPDHFRRAGRRALGEARALLRDCARGVLSALRRGIPTQGAPGLRQPVHVGRRSPTASARHPSMPAEGGAVTYDVWNALVDQARACDMIKIAEAHGATLKKSSGEYVGGCPVCDEGRDRFSIKPSQGFFNCRVCRKGGRGPIDLEMFLGGCDFVEAVKRLTNTESLSGLTTKKSLAAYDPERDRRRQQIAEEATQHAKAAWLWHQRQPAAGSPVETYLRARGFTGEIPPTIGYLPARGAHPHAMIAAFALPNEVEPNELGAPLVVRSVHRTKLLPDGSDRIREEKAKIIVGRPLGLPIAVSAITDGLSLVITEGIEDALAYRAAGFAAWAAGSAPFIPALAEYVADHVTTVIIEQHIDEQAQRAAARLQALLRERPVREGERPIEIIIREADE